MTKRKHKHAKILTRDTGMGRLTTYHLGNGKLHRLDGPAKILERSIRMGKPVGYGPIDEKHEWYRNGKIHRLDGPARYIAKDDGTINWDAFPSPEYHWRGRSISKLEHDQISRNNKLLGLLR